MGQNLLRTLLEKIQANNPPWFSVIADEATDVCNSAQLNLSIRSVNNKYEVLGDTVGLFRVPNTKVETLLTVIKDLLSYIFSVSWTSLRWCSKHAKKDIWSSSQISEWESSSHSCTLFYPFTKSMSSGNWKKWESIRNAIEVVKEVGKLILYSPKRLHLFSSTLQQASDSGVSLKLLCPTRWIARTVAINALLKDYNVLLEVLEEILMTTHDEYGTKASGLRHCWRNLIHFLGWS